MSYQKVTGSLMASGYAKLGTQEAANDMFVISGGVWCIGNGQTNDAVNPQKELCNTLNCMHDPMRILVVKCKAIGMEHRPLRH